MTNKPTGRTQIKLSRERRQASTSEQKQTQKPRRQRRTHRDQAGGNARPNSRNPARHGKQTQEPWKGIAEHGIKRPGQHTGMTNKLTGHTKKSWAENSRREATGEQAQANIKQSRDKAGGNAQPNIETNAKTATKSIAKHTMRGRDKSTAQPTGRTQIS